MQIKINKDSIIDEICRKTDIKEIVIYGAGNYGKILQRYLKTKYNTEIFCFAVSSSQNLGVDTIDGKDIKSIDELAKDKEQYQLIIAVAEQKQEELLAIALKLGFEDIYLLLNEYKRYMELQLDTYHLKPLDKLRMQIHVTDHCDLNCKGCYHFSPLSRESFLSVEEFERDMKQMAALCEGQALTIYLLGGEPLLHPGIIDFFCITRAYFQDTRIILLTNGLLLPKMKEEFWQSCVDNNVLIFCTKYPVKFDYETIEKKAESYHLSINYHNDVGAGEKTLIKYPFDLSGEQPIQWNYENCTRSNRCITLKHGRIFTCPMAAHAHIAKEYFDLDIELSKEDSIDIYHVQSSREISEFLTKPIPFCRYCDLTVKPDQLKWEVSKKEYDEWF